MSKGTRNSRGRGRRQGRDIAELLVALEGRRRRRIAFHTADVVGVREDRWPARRRRARAGQRARLVVAGTSRHRCRTPTPDRAMKEILAPGKARPRIDIPSARSVAAAGKATNRNPPSIAKADADQRRNSHRTIICDRHATASTVSAHQITGTHNRTETRSPTHRHSKGGRPIAKTGRQPEESAAPRRTCAQEFPHEGAV